MTVQSRIAGLVSALLLVVSLGCGSEPPARQDILDQPAEELHGSSMKALLYEFRAVVRKHGAAGARRDLPIVLENFEGYEEAPVGEHLDTYRQIVEKLEAMQSTIASASDDDVKAAVEEIGTLADSLPGEADPEPSVE